MAGRKIKSTAVWSPQLCKNKGSPAFAVIQEALFSEIFIYLFFNHLFDLNVLLLQLHFFHILQTYR